MSEPIIKSEAERKQAKELLGKDAPLHRKAYSDRTAWLMACIAELAYVKFNPPQVTERLAKKAESMLENGSKNPSKLKNAILLAIDTFAYDHVAERKLLEQQLEILDAKLIGTFDSKGTQALMIKTNKFLVLSFRGTEVAELKDIKTDAAANLVKCVTEGKVHSGFHEAFNLIEVDINEQLAQYPKLPLFITGHSLGGALATLAAKRITHTGGNAACYTFGAPRVSDDKWLMTMKTPIYRVVNSSDGVTMVAPRSFYITMIAWLVGLIPMFGKSWKKALTVHFGNYMHGGDMRFLTDVKKREFSKAKLLTHVSGWYRLKGWARKQFTFKKFGTDHSMAIYRSKLAYIAIARN
ncbi:lipase family protein [Idiomarina sp.]|uniref:lipase family protein n=1 Tax=Idiomarina sp. TaxID=1874361 RepID=UPI003A940917